MFKKLVSLCICALTWCVPTPSHSETQLPPNGVLEVAYNQLDEGKLSKSVHRLSLFCFDGQCSLTTLTLNQCFDLSDGKMFIPKIERTSTEEGNLKITLLNKTSLLAEEEYPQTVFKYKFTYTTKSDPEFSKAFGSRTNLWFAGLKDFSGAVIKDSDILNKVITWELVPLKGKWVNVKPLCDMSLPGVPQD